MKNLFLIPARGGSKGIPYKNIKIFGDKPLIIHSLEIARKLSDDSNICISTDDKKIISTVAKYNYTVPFIRPKELSTDEATTYSVIKHAFNFYMVELKKKYDTVILLQPTSPIRKPNHITEALQLFSKKIDMVVSVCESDSNPYYNLYEEKNGFLFRSKKSPYTRRQDCPKVWQYNGSIYVINTQSLLKYNSFNEFKKIIKYPMDKLYSIDIDNILDWEYAELIYTKLKNNLFHI